MKTAQLLAPVAVALAAGVIGCRSTTEILADYERNVIYGNYAAAAVEPAQKADEGGKDALCWQLHAAAAARLAGDCEGAVRRFDLAEDLFIDHASRGGVGSVADTTVSLMSGDYAMPYDGAGQDRIFTCLYKAIDFGVMGKPEAVRTELNRALLYQQSWREEQAADIAQAEARLQTDAKAYARSNGVAAKDASATVANAFGNRSFAESVMSGAGFDPVRDGRLELLSPGDYLNVYLAQVNETFRLYAGDSGPKPRDRVAVFVEDGMCPKRGAWRIDLPLGVMPWAGRYVKYAGMALPKLIYRNAAATAYSVSAAGANYQLVKIQDVDRLVKTEFDVEFRGALTREIVRAVTRVGVQVALGAARDSISDDNTRLALDLIQLGVAAYSACATDADIRSWTALPKSVYMLDLPRPADGAVTVNCGGERVRLSVPAGNTMVFVRKPSSAAPAVVKLFTLSN